LDLSYLAGLYCLGADAYLKEGRVSEALDSTERFMALGSEDASCWLIAGQVYESMRDLPNALSAYRRALEIMPSSAAAQEAVQRLVQ
jgi:tetratricopeptide (TPR) repeat protein